MNPSSSPHQPFTTPPPPPSNNDSVKEVLVETNTELLDARVVLQKNKDAQFKLCKQLAGEVCQCSGRAWVGGWMGVDGWMDRCVCVYVHVCFVSPSRKPPPPTILDSLTHSLTHSLTPTTTTTQTLTPDCPSGSAGCGRWCGRSRCTTPSTPSSRTSRACSGARCVHVPRNRLTSYRVMGMGGGWGGACHPALPVFQPRLSAWCLPACLPACLAPLPSHPSSPLHHPTRTYYYRYRVGWWPRPRRRRAPSSPTPTTATSPPCPPSSSGCVHVSQCCWYGCTQIRGCLFFQRPPSSSGCVRTCTHIPLPPSLPPCLVYSPQPIKSTHPPSPSSPPPSPPGAQAVAHAADLLRDERLHVGLPGVRRHVRRPPLPRGQPRPLHRRHLPLPLRGTWR